jgi:hypothetical protein
VCDALVGRLGGGGGGGGGGVVGGGQWGGSLLPMFKCISSTSNLENCQICEGEGWDLLLDPCSYSHGLHLLFLASLVVLLPQLFHLLFFRDGLLLLLPDLLLIPLVSRVPSLHT